MICINSNNNQIHFLCIEVSTHDRTSNSLVRVIGDGAIGR